MGKQFKRQVHSPKQLVDQVHSDKNALSIGEMINQSAFDYFSDSSELEFEQPKSEPKSAFTRINSQRAKRPCPELGCQMGPYSKSGLHKHLVDYHKKVLKHGGHNKKPAKVKLPKKRGRPFKPGKVKSAQVCLKTGQKGRYTRRNLTARFFTEFTTPLVGDLEISDALKKHREKRRAERRARGVDSSDSEDSIEAYEADFQSEPELVAKHCRDLIKEVSSSIEQLRFGPSEHLRTGFSSELSGNHPNTRLMTGFASSRVEGDTKRQCYETVVEGRDANGYADGKEKSTKYFIQLDAKKEAEVMQLFQGTQFPRGEVPFHAYISTQAYDQLALERQVVYEDIPYLRHLSLELDPIQNQILNYTQ